MSASDEIKKYTRQIQRNPYDAEAYYWRGTSYYKLEQYDRAIADLNKAIQINPNFVDPYLRLGLAYMELAQYDMAMFNFTKAIGINPNIDASVYKIRGNCYKELGFYSKAQADFARARELGYDG